MSEFVILGHLPGETPKNIMKPWEAHEMIEFVILGYLPGQNLRDLMKPSEANDFAYSL